MNFHFNEQKFWAADERVVWSSAGKSLLMGNYIGDIWF